MDCVRGTSNPPRVEAQSAVETTGGVNAMEDVTGTWTGTEEEPAIGVDE